MKYKQIIYWSYILIDRRFSFKALLFRLPSVSFACLERFNLPIFKRKECGTFIIFLFVK